MKRIYSLLLLPLFLLAACNNWLDVVPEEDITTIDTDFETRNEAYKWFKSCYIPLVHLGTSVRQSVAFVGCDEFVMCPYERKYSKEGTGEQWFFGDYISSGQQNVFSPYEDLWVTRAYSADGAAYRKDYYTAISLCNIFIDKIDKVYNMDDKEKARWKGEVIALKAFYYFELVRHYGPVILTPGFMDPNQDVADLKLPRSHVDTCFQRIVDLCDEAIATGIPSVKEQETNHFGYFNKEAAMALKARALCYQASDLFNGNPAYANFKNRNGEPLFNPTYDKEKWHRAAIAADEAIEACLIAGKKLIDNRTAATPLQSTMLNIESSVRAANFSSTEALLMVRRGEQSSGEFYYWTLPNLESDPNGFLRGSVLSPSMKMVEMFYTENGLPMDQDPNYVNANRYGFTQEKDPKYNDVVALNEDIVRLHTRREPRFYASIAADRCYCRWGRSTESIFKVTAYQGEDWGLKVKRLTATTPENITGYWLKKGTSSDAELYTYDNSVAALGENPMILIRMAELYLLSAEAWNEYLGEPDEKVYGPLNVIRKRAGIPDVKTAWANAKDKGKENTKNGMRDIIRQEWNIEFMFEGMRFWNLRRWRIAEQELNDNLYGWNVTGNNANAFYNYGKDPVIVDSDREFVAPRDYFWPIRSEETLISGVVQNPGW